MLMEKLQQERICIAVSSTASCRRALEDTIAYVKQRQAFGQPIAAFQNTQFTLAELATAGRDRPGVRRSPARRHVRGEDVGGRGVDGEVVDDRSPEDAHRRVPAAPRRLRLHARVPDRDGLRRRRRAVDLRRHNEIMKVIIARRMGLG
jgi:alkylation response protein AidB-like acyl-CoA dehydrogenase